MSSRVWRLLELKDSSFNKWKKKKIVSSCSRQNIPNFKHTVSAVQGRTEPTREQIIRSWHSTKLARKQVRECQNLSLVKREKGRSPIVMDLWIFANNLWNVFTLICLKKVIHNVLLKYCKNGSKWKPNFKWKLKMSKSVLSWFTKTNNKKQSDSDLP